MPPESESTEKRAVPDIPAVIAHITRAAKCGIVKVITIGPLVLFSTPTRDAWMLDMEDDFARCLMRDGEALSTGVRETHHQWAIEWNADFHLDGDSFVVHPRNGTVRRILGYPVDAIRRAITMASRGTTPK